MISAYGNGSRSIAVLNRTLLNVTAATVSRDLNPFEFVLTPAKKIELTAWIILTSILGLVGALNNLLVLLVTWPRNSNSSGLNLLIFHFIAANLYECLAITANVFIVQAKQDGHQVPPNTCNSLHTLVTIGSMVVNWADASLAINRCIALYFPHSYRAWTTKSVNLLMVTFIWSVSLAAVVPVAFRIGGLMVMNQVGQCLYFPIGRLGTLFSSMILVPYGIAGIGALLILWKSCGHNAGNRVSAQTSDRARRVATRRIKMAQMLLVTFLWSVICVIPWAVISSRFPFIFITQPVSIMWLRTCSILQYGFTPCVMLLANAEYRKRLGQIVFRRQRDGQFETSQQDNSRSMTNTNNDTKEKAIPED